MEGCADAGQMKLVEGLLTSVDCTVGGMAQTGYNNLIGPDSIFSTALTVILTLYIAIMGLRLMLGLAPMRFGDVTMAVVKIGVVLALATNWPVYQRVVFDLLYSGPTELAGQALGSQYAVHGPFGGLQMAFDEMQASAEYFAQRAPAVSSPFVGGPAFGAFALNAASMTMLLSTLGVVLASKIVLIGLLTFGPVFVTFLLFDATRGLFLGWLRGAIALAFAPLFSILALAIQLVLVQPHLTDLAQLRAAGGVDLAAPIAIFALTGITSGVSLIGLVMVGVIGLGLKLPQRNASPARDADGQAAPAAQSSTASGAVGQGAMPFEAPPRAASVAAAAAAMDRRDSWVLVSASANSNFAPASPSLASVGGASPQTALGQSYRRNVSPSRTASSARRDR